MYFLMQSSRELGELLSRVELDTIFRGVERDRDRFLATQFREISRLIKLGSANETAPGPLKDLERVFIFLGVPVRMT